MAVCLSVGLRCASVGADVKMDRMARPSRMNDPVIVRVGSVWTPKYPHHGKQAPLQVLERVDRPNGTNFVVKSLEDGGINRTRLLSYKYLLAQYLEQTSVEQ